MLSIRRDVKDLEPSVSFPEPNMVPNRMEILKNVAELAEANMEHAIALLDSVDVIFHTKRCGKINRACAYTDFMTVGIINRYIWQMIGDNARALMTPEGSSVSLSNLIDEVYRA